MALLKNRIHQNNCQIIMNGSSTFGMLFFAHRELFHFEKKLPKVSVCVHRMLFDAVFGGIPQLLPHFI